MTNSTDAVFGANGTAFTVEKYWCVYPLSGQYTGMQRILFYVAILFAFFTRYHRWLSSCALVFVMIYTLTAAIHAISLGLQSHVDCDPDILAIILILPVAFLSSIGAFIFFPKINYHDIRPIYVAWQFILGSALYLGGKAFTRFFHSAAQYTANVKVMAEAESPDPCSIFEPKVLFRGGPNDGLNAVLVDRWTTWNDTLFTNDTTVVSDSSGNLTIGSGTSPGIPQWGLSLLMVTGCLNIARPPRESCRIAFQYMLSRPVPKPATRRFHRLVIYLMVILEPIVRLILYPVILLVHPGVETRRDIACEIPLWHHMNTNVRHLNSAREIQCAKCMALLWYFVCLLGYLAWPSIILYAVIIFETELLQMLPESETPFAVGQWAPWVAFALSGLVVIVCELSKRRSNKQKQGDHQLPLLTRDDSDIAGRSNIDEQSNGLWGLTEVVDEWRNLQTWWRNPLEEADADGAPAATQSHEAIPEAISLEELRPGMIRTRTRTW